MDGNRLVTGLPRTTAKLMEVNEVRGKILIVDDDPNALRLIGYALQVEGYEVVTAESGSEALRAVEGEQPALVILDVMMPDMSGLEVCRRLRSDGRTAYLPILMLSAKGKVEDKVTGFKAGADDYVPKPVDPAELVARVEALTLRAARAAPPSPRARFLAFLGAKGGVGTTTVAVNVALAVIQQGKTVILVDLHPYLGTVCPLLGLDPPHSLAEAILDGLSTLADFVMFDLPLHPTSISQTVLDRCDFVALITEPDPIALRCAQRRLTLLQQWGIMGELVGVVVVNRSPSVMTMTLDELQDLLGAVIVGVVPPAPEACLHALRQGAPLLLTQPEHLATRMLQELAQRLAREHPTASPY